MRLLAAARLSVRARARSERGPGLDPLRPRRLFFGGLAVGLIAMSVVGLATSVFIASPRDVAAQSAAPAATPITAVVRWQVLRHAITVQGIVRARRPILVTAMAPFSTVVLTRMPEKAGDRVKPGHVIAEIDGRPVILLRGRLPAYRNLHEGDHGPDVTQLQRGLLRLGYADYDARGHFGESTALALLLFYRHLGYDAPIYHRRAAQAPAAHGIAGRRTANALSVPSAYLPRSEVVFIPSRSALVTAVGGRTGDLVGGSVVLTLATGDPYVTAGLTAHQAAQARRGMSATIVAVSPARTSRGTVTRVGSLPPVGGPPPHGYPVLVRPRRALPQRMIGASVRLTLRAAVTTEPVLTVPVAAIMPASSGLANNGPAGQVQADRVVKLTAGRRVRVAVVTGPTADGLVAVQPVRRGSLRPGDHVLIGAGRWPPSR
ncbi:MAG TPA: peptidoglycan-binding domain-containing protein [Streptosporangiaceae bacterium]|nr:peptidoglycan-binding domain-containing protein [Streptosporangiaceae bacterium]